MLHLKWLHWRETNRIFMTQRKSNNRNFRISNTYFHLNSKHIQSDEGGEFCNKMFLSIFLWCSVCAIFCSKFFTIFPDTFGGISSKKHPPHLFEFKWKAPGENICDIICPKWSYISLLNGIGNSWRSRLYYLINNSAPFYRFSFLLLKRNLWEDK